MMMPSSLLTSDYCLKLTGIMFSFCPLYLLLLCSSEVRFMGPQYGIQSWSLSMRGIVEVYPPQPHTQSNQYRILQRVANRISALSTFARMQFGSSHSMTVVFALHPH